MPGARQRLSLTPWSRSTLSSHWLAGGSGQKPAPAAPRLHARTSSILQSVSAEARAPYKKPSLTNVLGRFRDAKGEKNDCRGETPFTCARMQVLLSTRGRHRLLIRKMNKKKGFMRCMQNHPGAAPYKACWEKWALAELEKMDYQKHTVTLTRHTHLLCQYT